jgi:hypothetical protein
MKRKLLKSAVGLLLAGCALSANAQLSNLVDAKLLVNSPSSIAGVKTITNSGTNSWGRTIDSFWFNVPLIKAHNVPVNSTDGDSLACNPLDNGTGSVPSLVGKFALIYRGTCEFGAKALNAQQHGAIGVIIVNNIPGSPVGMGAGAVGNQVTIPVLMVSQTDGNAMNALLRTGNPVNVSLSRWGFGFANDLGIVGNSMPMPHASAMPLSQLLSTAGTPTPYKNYMGAFVANFGSANQTNIVLRDVVTFTPTGGSATFVRADSLTDPTFNALDSLKTTYFSPNSYSLNAATTGQFNFTYSVNGSATDQQPTDNVYTIPMYVTDSTFCKGRYDNATGKPIATGGFRFGGTLAGNTMTWGPLYYVAKGKYQAAKVSFAIAVDSPTLKDEGTSFIYLFKWKDLNSDKKITGNELTIKGIASKTYGTLDSSYKIQTASFKVSGSANTPVITEDSSWYWVAVETSPNQFMAVDNESNYFSRSFAARNATPNVIEYWAPNFVGSAAPPVAAGATLLMLPFDQNNTDIDSVSFIGQKGLVPAVALHLSKQTVGVTAETPSNFRNINIYPNPATTQLTLVLDLVQPTSKVEFRIIDAVGKNLHRSSSPKVQNGKYTFSLDGYAPGQYYLVIGTDQGATAQPFIVGGK